MNVDRAHLELTIVEADDDLFPEPQRPYRYIVLAIAGLALFVLALAAFGGSR